MTKRRTDPHRAGAIIPAEYTYILSYNQSTSQEGWPVPSFGINCELDRRKEIKDENGNHVGWENGKHAPDGHCCVVGLRHIAKVKFAAHGGTGKCSSCGTHFVYGSIYRHEPTGEYVNIGNICADKMDLHADRSAYEMGRNRVWAATMAQQERERKAEARKAWLADHPGVEEALECDHHIVQDIKHRFIQWCSLSDKQIELVFKLAKEAKEPKKQETPVAAQIEDGRQVVEGEIVSIKSHESMYGTVLKMTVKVHPHGDDRFWLAWGTMPLSLYADRGDIVRFSAKLKQGREEHFTLFSRPTKAEVVKAASERDNEEAGAAV